MSTRTQTARLLFKVGLLSLYLFPIPTLHFLSSTALSQDSKTHPIESRLQASPDSQVVEFQVPEGYMRSDLPNQDGRRYKGLLMLDPDKPGGMFIILLGESQTVDDLEAAAESIIKRIFVHNSKPEPAWNSSPLPPHQEVSDESGKLVMGLSQVQDIQIAIYRRTFGKAPLIYGYFAMRDNTGTMKEPNGKFLDGAGRGVKVFDEFWRSIKEAK